MGFPLRVVMPTGCSSSWSKIIIFLKLNWLKVWLKILINSFCVRGGLVGIKITFNLFKVAEK